MSVEEIIKKSEKPNTKESLVKNLINMGLKSGDTVIVHSSLSSVGWICGGAIALIEALMEVISEKGTIVMPTHSADYSNPEQWENPAIPKEWIEIIKENMPAFDVQITPTFWMGKVAEQFRSFPNIYRSYHPTVSFAAWGTKSKEITSEHSLEYSLGEKSPLNKLYQLGAKVLLIGVGYEDNTSFHLAEYKAENYETTICESPIKVEGRRVWSKYIDIEFKTELFDEIGMAFEKEACVIKGKIGQADAKLFSQNEAVDFAAKWLKAKI